jgi:hypothetical protein
VDVTGIDAEHIAAAGVVVVALWQSYLAAKTPPSRGDGVDAAPEEVDGPPAAGFPLSLPGSLLPGRRGRWRAGGGKE